METGLMRICLYTATALPKVGGQELVVDALGRELVGRGHEVVVVAPEARRPLVAQDQGLPYRMVRHPRFVSTRWGVGWYGRYLRKLEREVGRFQVVHCHDVYPTGWLGVREFGRRVVITSHGGDLNEGNVRIVKPGVEARCVEAIEGAGGLVSIGRFTEGNFRRLTGKLPRMVTIPNGVNVEELAGGSGGGEVEMPEEMKRAGWEGGAFLLCLGRLHRRKGVDVLLRAVARVEGVKLVVAGEGDEREGLEGLAGELGLGDRVLFLGKRVGGEKRWLLRQARVVVMPSRGWEAFPLVVLEAAAGGKGVIASRVAGLEDLVEDGVTGRLVGAEDVERLAGAIGEAMRAGVAEAWGEAGFARVGRYAWGKVAGEYEAFYREVAGAGLRG